MNPVQSEERDTKAAVSMIECQSNQTPALLVDVLFGVVSPARVQGRLMTHLSLHCLLLEEHVGAWSSYALPCFCQFCLFSRSDLILLSW